MTNLTNQDLVNQRLHNQHIASAPFEKPEQVVQWMGAVQSQDYAGAKWALGLRSRGVTDVDIEQAFTSGAILRTHVMRPTWHFVAPADIRWMLALTAPRVNAASAYYYRRVGLDDDVFARSNDALAKALQGGRQLTRPELVSVLRQAGLATDDTLRSTYIIMHAELDGVFCSGARRGKQFTYALLDERAPQARTLSRDEALAELTRRYFTSHGPATAHDFAWWSGLTTADARAGLEMVGPQLMSEVVDGQTCWLSPSTPPDRELSQTTYLLPNYDEYTVGYTDRGAILDAPLKNKFGIRGDVLNYVIVIDGRAAGTWKRTLAKDSVIIEANLFFPLDEAGTRALAAAADRYGQFLGLPVKLSLQGCAR